MKLWVLPTLGRIRLVKTPNLAGIWNGQITSSFDQDAPKYDATIHIIQTWTHMSIKMATAVSESKSLVATVAVGDAAGPLLSYEYLNEPKANAASTMHIHRGTARMTLTSDGNELAGEYYTGRDRQTFGLLHFVRVREKDDTDPPSG